MELGGSAMVGEPVAGREAGKSACVGVRQARAEAATADSRRRAPGCQSVS